MLCYSVTRIGKRVQEPFRGAIWGRGFAGFFEKQKNEKTRPQMASNSLLTIM